MISCFSFSQGLTPTVHELNGDTNFCFTIPQSKLIAQRIEANSYYDSITTAQNEVIHLLSQADSTKNQVIDLLNMKIANFNTIAINNKMSIAHLEQTITVQEKQLKRGKFYKILLSIALGTVTIMAITD